MTDLYRVLNLLPTATANEIQAAYARERARVNAEIQDPDEAARRRAALDEAYATLSDTSKRAAYDQSLSSNASEALIQAQPPAPSVAPQTPAIPIAQQPCPHCGALNPVQATLCIQCRKQISRPCPVCGRPVLLGQVICARCNTFIPEYDQRRFAEGLAMAERVQNERAESDARAEVIGKAYQTAAKQGVIFWAILLLVFCIVTALAVAVFNYAAQ
jgi:hypothetical protein